LLLLWSELAKRALLPENVNSNIAGLVIVVVVLQALACPIFYAALAQGKLVLIKSSTTLFCAILSAACCLSGFLKALKSMHSISVPNPVECDGVSALFWPVSLVSSAFASLASSHWWLSLALHNGWSSVMTLDSFILTLTALVYIGTEDAPNVPAFIRRICLGLTLLIPTGPIGLCLFAMFNNN
jgi:hypothetical protein